MTIRQLSQCLQNVVGNFSHSSLALYRLGETRRDRGQVVLPALRNSGAIWLTPQTVISSDSNAVTISS